MKELAKQIFMFRSGDLTKQIMFWLIMHIHYKILTPIPLHIQLTSIRPIPRKTTITMTNESARYTRRPSTQPLEKKMKQCTIHCEWRRGNSITLDELTEIISLIRNKNIHGSFHFSTHIGTVFSC